MSELTYKEVDAILRYDPETGKLFWKSRTPDMFNASKYSAELSCRTWNTKFAGKEALTTDNGLGYKTGYIFAKHYKAHRVAWLLTHGEWPSDNIDHINGTRSDNRIVNLRVASYVENARNQTMRRNNKSGVLGVHWDKQAGKWLASIRVNGVLKHLGLFEKLEDAAACRKSAQVQAGFHPNHGKARLGGKG